MTAIVRLTFQFPSNGKVYSKWLLLVEEVLTNQCFNSLQTGKCIARELYDQ